MTAIDTLEREAVEAWRPPKRMSLSEWSDAHAYLSAESSAQEGRWRTLPYQRGWLDAMTDPTVEQIVVMKSARVGYTKCLNNLIGYHIHHDPCPIMLVQPTESDAEGYSKDEIAPMVRDTPALAGLVADAKSRDSGNTILAKTFPGGVLQLVGANSPRGFRRVSRRIVLFDEVDGYPPSAGNEGDQIKLGIKRSEYYWNRKIVTGSTPTVKDVSRIERMFLETDQRRYFVPCPHCGGLQFLKWGANQPYGVKWPSGRPLEAVYVCEHCGESIRHAQKYDMVEAGGWRPTAAAVRPGLVGFHLWAAYSYSPNATWGQLALEWVEAQGKPDLLKTFVNTALGETWEEDYSARLDADLLRNRAEDYLQFVAPDGVLLMTVGVDVQADRIELQFVGWGTGEEAWVLGYIVISGDPSDPEIWLQVRAAIDTPAVLPDGTEIVAFAAAIDSGDGNLTNEVYAFAREHRARHVLAIKGMSGSRPPIGAPTKQDINLRGQKVERGALLYPVGVDTIKSTTYARLKRSDRTGPGAVHFPSDLPDTYFDQLTAEKQATKMVHGFAKRYWKKADGERNEALDTFVYAYAALHYVISRHNRATFWQQMASRLSEAAERMAESRRLAESGVKTPISAVSGGKISLSGWRRGG